MLQASFPLDILLETIDLLAAHVDLVSVKACSLTCRALRPFCQKHIFTEIDLVPRLSEDQEEYSLVPSFARRIFSNPDLAPYVKTLNICFQKSDYRGGLLASVLQSLHGITSLSLTSSKKRLIWDKLNDSLRISLEHVIKSSKLVRLDLKYCERFPIALLRMPKNLSHLSFGSVPDSQGLDTDILKGSRQAPTRLRCFSFESTGSIAAQRLLHERWEDAPLLNFLSLSELGIAVHIDYVTGQSTGFEIAQELVPQLQALRNLSYNVRSPMTFARLLHLIRRSSFETLKTLAFSAIISAGEDPWLGLCDELVVIPKENVIEEMKFLMLVIPGYDSCINLEAWRALSNKLGRSSFPTLAKITIEIHLDRYADNADTQQQALLNMEDECFAGIRQEYCRGFEFSVVLTDI